MKRILLFAFLVCGTAYSLHAQSLESLLKGAASSVLSTSAPTATMIEGNWIYSGISSKFESDDLLAKAGGVALAASVNEKLSGLCKKVGIQPGSFSFTFNADGSFTNKTPVKGDLKGNYTLDREKGTITLVYTTTTKIKIGTITAQISRSVDNLSLLFDADKLMSLLQKISSVSNNASISSVSALLSKYDGLQLGLELSKQ